jgi:hypothetical protein
MRMQTFSRSLIALGLIVGLAPLAPTDEPKTAEKKPATTLPTGTLTTKDWLTPSTAPLKAAEIDQLVNAQLERAKIKPAALTTDEQFLRRATIDLTGRLPSAAELSQFLAETNSDKRAKAIDRLLASNEFGRHWARYWREVISSRTTSQFANFFARPFEGWLAKELNDNKNWADITRGILNASGPMRFDDPNTNAEGYFLAGRTGADAVTERAAETSRVFLGVQIQCAQCHDHPSDVWKRQQFHEFAAYFARLRDRFIFEEKRIAGVQLSSVQFGEHQMADLKNPRQTTAMQPRFLDGKGPAGQIASSTTPSVKGPGPGGKGPKGFGGKGFGGKGGGGLADAPRRKSLTESIVAKDNPWFAGAFVNRIWGELLGQAFYQPVDDLGPQKEAVMPDVLSRLSGAFRGSDYDIKGLYREIMNSQTYQRQLRPTDPGEDHLLFSSTSPRRMSADVLWQNLVGTLGPLGGGAGPKGGFKGGPGGFRGGLEQNFKREFQFDPSIKTEDVEGTISQALLLMNNPVINQKIQAKNGTMLAKILESNANNDDAIKGVYQRTLGRRPSERELDRCRTHLGAVTNRAEAFEDILWALINSTEFQTRR